MSRKASTTWPRATLRSDEDFDIERFESAGIEQRVFVFAAMANVTELALWTEGGLGRSYTGFAWTYIAVLSVNIVQ